jgi:hypothetical protein
MKRTCKAKRWVQLDAAGPAAHVDVKDRKHSVLTGSGKPTASVATSAPACDNGSSTGPARDDRLGPGPAPSRRRPEAGFETTPTVPKRASRSAGSPCSLCRMGAAARDAPATGRHFRSARSSGTCGCNVRRRVGGSGIDQSRVRPQSESSENTGLSTSGGARAGHAARSRRQPRSQRAGMGRSTGSRAARSEATVSSAARPDARRRAGDHLELAPLVLDRDPITDHRG